MDDRWQYLLLLLACVLITLPLEWLLRARVYARWKRMILSLLPMLIVFLTWDVVGIWRGHWTYSQRYTTGIAVGPVPLEELLFFVVVPICGLLTYEAVGTVLQWLSRRRDA